MRDDRFVLCIQNEAYEASLERRKIYRVIADAAKGNVAFVDG